MSTHKAVLTAQGGQCFHIIFNKQGMRISSTSILHHKEIVKYLSIHKICVMSVHKICLSDQTFINQLCERSEFSLCTIKDILMIAHTPVLSTHRGFFSSNFFHHAPEISFPHILGDFMLKKTIIGYLILFLMSAHKM